MFKMPRGRQGSIESCSVPLRGSPSGWEICMQHAEGFSRKKSQCQCVTRPRTNTDQQTHAEECWQWCRAKSMVSRAKLSGFVQLVDLGQVISLSVPQFLEMKRRQYLPPMMVVKIKTNQYLPNASKIRLDIQ